MANNDLQLLEHEAQRKVGRNIMNFQRVELLLKYLISRSQLHGLTSELEGALVKREKNVHKKTLGLLSKELFKTIYNERDPVEPPVVLEEPWLSFTFHCEIDDCSKLENFKLQLERLVDQRNDLVHHRLHSVNRKSLESWRELIIFLDTQRDNTIPIFEWLRGLVLSMSKASKVLGEVKIAPDT